MLMVISNLGKAPIRSVIQLAPDVPQADRLVRLRDLEIETAARWTPLRDRSFQVTVPGENFRILLLAP